MHYLELGLEMLLEKDALRPCDTSACLWDNAAGGLPKKSGSNSDGRWTKRALQGALERASCLTQEASLGKA